MSVMIVYMVLVMISVLLAQIMTALECVGFGVGVGVGSVVIAAGTWVVLVMIHAVETLFFKSVV